MASAVVHVGAYIPHRCLRVHIGAGVVPKIAPGLPRFYFTHLGPQTFQNESREVLAFPTELSDVTLCLGFRYIMFG